MYDGVTVSFFEKKDFEWLNSGITAVPFSTLMNVVDDPHAIVSMAREMVVTLRGESSKNKVVEQIIKQRLGDDFTVTHKPTTLLKG